MNITFDTNRGHRAWRTAMGWLRGLPHRAELALAMMAAAASLTPSLLPKTVAVQGIVTGITAVVGYMLGAFGHWLLAPVRRRLRRPTRELAGWVLLCGAVLWLVLTLWTSQAAQRELAVSIGGENPATIQMTAVLLVATAVLTVALTAARTARSLIRHIAVRLWPWLPRWLAMVATASAMATLTAVVGYEVVRQDLLESADQPFRLADERRSLGLPPPQDPLRTGGPGSQVTWSTLGHWGRQFLSLPAPTDGKPPVRVYVGIESATDLTARADLVVTELERTGALDRAVVCLVVPTGTGWVDPAAVTALEAQFGGDTAVAAMQYSYLPSVLALWVDRFQVDAAAQAMLAAVVRRWQDLPATGRPRLMLYGESLGSRGVEVAMRTVPGADQMVDGVLLVGPPASNPVHAELVANRDQGSSQLAPVIDGGRQVRFWPGPELPNQHGPDDPWPTPASGPRTLYLRHPSDPIVWWSTSLLWRQPSWVDERAALAGAPPLHWKPIVTFWQISGDTIFATEVPAGHGHEYKGELADAWAALAPSEPP